MKRVFLLFTALVLLFSNIAKADEGMWFLAFINKNYDEMKAMGLKLTPEEIYSINNSSLKDAVVALDHGSCTGELVSKKGLLLTNHHCGYGEIQAHSTVEDDYLTNGFWAMTLEEELPNPGKTVSFLIRMEDVTDKVLAEVNDKMSETEREMVIQTISDKLIEKAISGTNYEAEVNSFFNGNNYYLFVYETFLDVRLVGAPPESIGKFGADTDNWMWPRHTGDFSMFRVYCAPDGSPAEYSTENIPYEPKKFLTINIGGIEENDFTMVMGYPGTTNRWLTSWGVENTIEHENKIRIKVREEKLRILKEDMDADDAVRIQYASKYAQSANYYKYSIGQNLGLDKLELVERKQSIEKKLTKWIKQDKKNRKEKYGEMLNIIDEAYKANDEYDAALNYWFEAIYQGSELTGIALSARRLDYMLQSGNEDNITAVATALKDEAETFFKDFNLATDKKLFIAMFKMYKENVTNTLFHPSIFTDINNNYAGSFEKYAEDVYNKSIFSDYDRYVEFLSNPDIEILENDLGYIVATSALNAYFSITDGMEDNNNNLTKGYRLYSDALIQLMKEKDENTLFYPDANSTMRISYGTVGGYTVDGKTYTFKTNVDEYMAKEDATNPEFFVTDRMKELYKAKDYGKYAENGTLPLCFTTNNDITGGNSGSPVMNDKGELIGLAFDGNWEAMSGDIAFETELQKTICVDIRFVLWVIDKYAGATHFTDEMNIVTE